MDISSWISHRAALTPQKTALRFEGTEISYAALEQRVARLAGGLATTAGPGQRVAYLGPNCPEILELLFACSRTGAVLVPLNARMPPEELRVFVEDCGPTLIFAEESYAPAAAEAARGLAGVVVSSFSTPGDGLGHGAPLARLRAHDSVPLLLAYTSGSTGRPKGALLHGDALLFNALNASAAYDLRSSDHVLTVLPMFHVGGLNILTTPALMCGATVTIERAADAGRALDALGSARPTLTVLVPRVSLAMVGHPAWPRANAECLRGMLIGSTIVPEAAVRPWLERGVPVSQVYGLTESCPIATVVPLARSRDKVATAGLPAMWCDVRIHSDHPGQPGEVLLRGPNVMRGYWRDQEATRATFAPGGWLRSGDIGFLDEDGYLHVVDRLKDMLVVGGSNVYPADLERVLSECDAIREAAVVGRPDEVLGEVPVACVVLEEPGAMTAGDVRRLFEGRIAAYKHPHDVVFVDALPRNVLGKVKKAELRSLAASGRWTDVAVQAPPGPGHRSA